MVWKRVVQGQVVLLAMSNTIIAGGSTAVLQMRWFSVIVGVIVLSCSGDLSWKDKKAFRVGVLIGLFVWAKILTLSSSMEVASFEKPWRATNFVVCPRIGKPSWWW